MRSKNRGIIHCYGANQGHAENMTQEIGSSNGSVATGNALLAALPLSESARIIEAGEYVALLQDEVLGDFGAELREVYFPYDCAIAVMSEAEGKQALAVDLIGREGMLGVAAVLGGRPSSLRAQVLSPGRALRLDIDEFRGVLDNSPRLQAGLMAHVDVLLAQYAQVAACAAYHVVEMRLSWWLLMTHDRVRGDRFEATHDLLARMLGVRRSSVTRAAGDLQDRKLIAYSRGRIVIHDRRGLEQAACRCYALMQAANEQPQPQAAAAGDPGPAFTLVRPSRTQRQAKARLRASQEQRDMHVARAVGAASGAKR